MQRKEIGKYSIVHNTIKNWKHLPAETIGTFLSKSKNFRKRVRKAIMKGEKRKEEKCGENNLQEQ